MIEIYYFPDQKTKKNLNQKHITRHLFKLTYRGSKKQGRARSRDFVTAEGIAVNLTPVDKAKWNADRTSYEQNRQYDLDS